MLGSYLVVQRKIKTIKEWGKAGRREERGEEREITVLVVSFSYIQILKSKNVKILLSPSAVNK